MKAIAVVPGRPNSVHLAELAKPSLSDVPDGRGVLVRVLRVVTPSGFTSGATHTFRSTSVLSFSVSASSAS